jgi:hypothetical protein
MADFKFNPETGEYDYVGTGYEGAPEPEAQPDAVAPESAPVDVFAPTYGSPEQRQADALEAEQGATAVALQEKGGDERPVWAQDVGQGLRDLGKSIINPATALVTDYVDLGHGLVDIAGQTGNLIQGKGFDVGQVFDDSDNPLTAARINAFRSETQAGQFANTTARVVVALASLPKVAIKWGLVAPLKALSKLPAGGKGFGAAAKGLTKFDDAIKAPREGTKAATTALSKIQGKAPSSTVAKLANADDWLKLTYKDIVNAGVEGNAFAVGMRSAERAAKSLTKGKASLRNVGEALAWDAFVAFNTAGEGNPMLDETMTDFLAEAGLPNVPLFRTSIRDTGLEAKFKQMGEGVILGGIIESTMDVARIFRFSQAFKKANTVEKNAIIRAFNAEAEGLGGGFAKLQEVADSTVKSRPAAASSIAQGPRDKNWNYQLLDMELDRVNAARSQNQLTEETQANLLKLKQQRALMGEGTQAGLLGQQKKQSALATQADLGADMPVYPVDVQVIRPPEPTITPQTMRTGFQDYVRNRFVEQNPEFVQQLVDTTKRLMPRNRVDAIDYLEQFPLRYNGLGMMQASDSIANNYMIQRGLEEGWMSVDGDLALMYNRKLAFDFDRNEYAVKQATALDEAAEIERYNAKMSQQGTDPATQEVQGALDPAKRDAQEAARQYDDFESNPNAPGNVSDQALVEARRQEQLAAVQEAGAKNAEQLQVDVDAIAAYGDIGSDRQVVAEMLNLDLDNLPEYAIEKIGNRQYQVVDELGESIDGNTYSTLKGARKGADVANKGQRKEYVAKARALADRATDQPVQSRFGVEISDSPAVRGELKLTKRQAEVLGELGVPINGTTLDLSQADLDGMAKSLTQLMEGTTGPQRRVLGNILKRVDEKVIDLVPAARLAAEVDKTIATSQKFLKDGEICF